MPPNPNIPSNLHEPLLVLESSLERFNAVYQPTLEEPELSELRRVLDRIKSAATRLEKAFRTIFDKDEGLSEPDWRESILTLHRYFWWARRLERNFKDALASQQKTIEEGRSRAGIDVQNATPDELGFLKVLEFLSSDFGIYLFHYYGALCPVIEGFWELKLRDDAVDSLLKSKHTSALQRSRNAVFHFQREYFSKKLLDRDLNQTEFIDWVSKLHDALGACLARELTAAGLLP